MSATTQVLPQDVGVRARGLLLGAAVGDALGWPQEMRSNIVGGKRARELAAKPQFRTWDRNSGTQFARYLETVRAGEYSDDTQLLLAVARACERGEEWWEHLSRVELPAWVAYQRGGGRAVVSASRSWAAGQPPWLAATASARSAQGPSQYFKAGANGVAMRIAPHVLFCLSDPDPGRLIGRVVADGITTHGHARALVGGVAHAVTLRAALLRSGTMAYGDLLDQLAEKELWDTFELREAVADDWSRSFESQVGERPDEAWRQAVNETRDLVEIARRALSRGALADDEAALADMGCFDPKVNGAGTVTAVAAAYSAARSAARPITGLLRTAYLKRADTDTLASMTASILGALHGPGWLADLSRDVQDAEYIAGFERLTRGASEADSPGQAPLFKDGGRSDRRMRLAVSRQGLKGFAEALADMVVGDRGEFVDGRPFDVRETADLAAKGNITVARWRLQLADGQTLVIDRTRKEAATGREGERQQPSAEARAAKDPRSSVSRITLLVNDLPAIAGFYRSVIGLPVRGTGGGFVELGPGLRLCQRDKSSSAAADDLLEIKVPSLEHVRRRMAGDAPPVRDHELKLQDPEGRAVILRE
ncbi:MAG: ADP-ribosylglycohydrolase family protein [Actinomycetota bacterium]|nr:ADP-ribosylglycohydrolase family protein [Actinomycetota bacterium]